MKVGIVNWRVAGIQNGSAGKHVAYVLLIVSILPGANGQNVHSLVAEDCKKEQELSQLPKMAERLALVLTRKTKAVIIEHVQVKTKKPKVK